MTEPSRDPALSRAEQTRDADDAPGNDDECRGHKDLHRAAQASLEHSAGPEGADPVDDMQTEPADSEADGERRRPR